MSGEESTGNAPKTNVETSVADDKRSIMLKLGIGESAPMVVPLDTTAVDLLISTLGAARSEMIEPIPADLSGTFPITAYNPRWHIFPDSENASRLFGLGTLATDGRYTVLLATRRRTSRNG